MIRIILFVFLVFIPAGWLSAQAPAAVENNTPSFRVFTVLGDIRDLKYDQRPGPRGTDLFVMQTPSITYPMPASRHLVIYREVPPPPSAPPGTPPRKETVAEATLPPNTPRALVVLIRLANGQFNAVTLDDAPAQHPAGKLRLLNLSKLNSAVGLNQARHQLAPGGSALVDPGTGGVLIQVAAQKDGAWKIAYRKERLTRTRARSYGMIFDYVPDPFMNEDPADPPPATIRFFHETVPLDKAG